MHRSRYWTGETMNRHRPSGLVGRTKDSVYEPDRTSRLRAPLIEISPASSLEAVSDANESNECRIQRASCPSTLPLRNWRRVRPRGPVKNVGASPASCTVPNHLRDRPGTARLQSNRRPGLRSSSRFWRSYEQRAMRNEHQAGFRSHRIFRFACRADIAGQCWNIGTIRNH